MKDESVEPSDVMPDQTLDRRVSNVSPFNPALKVLHICETAQGGVGTYINTLVDLEKDSATSAVILPDAHSDVIKSDCEKIVFRYPGRSVGSVIRLLSVSVKEKFRFRPDIIFCHSSFSLLALFLLRPISGKTKFIYCAHGWAGAREDENSAKGAVFRWAEARLAGLSHRVVNISNSDLDFARRHGYSGRHTLIVSGVRPPPSDLPPAVFGQDPDLIHLLFVGRHDRQKGLDILLEAFAVARKNRPDLRLHVIGTAVLADGNYVGPTDGVDFLGWVDHDQIDRYYKSADLLVVPSRWEGFGLVVPEALRNGTPVLASNRGALPELIEQNVTGHVVALGVAEFAEAMIALEKAKLSVMRPACRSQFSTRYHAQRFGEEMCALYSEVIVI